MGAGEIARWKQHVAAQNVWDSAKLNGEEPGLAEVPCPEHIIVKFLCPLEHFLLCLQSFFVGACRTLNSLLLHNGFATIQLAKERDGLELLAGEVDTPADCPVAKPETLLGRERNGRGFRSACQTSP